MIQVLFKGKDITSYVSINRCYHDMYAEKRADTLSIRFNDVDGSWDKWQPQIGDEIKIVYGSAGTGKMFVTEATPENGLYTIKATSLPKTVKTVKNKAWQQIRLLKMGKEIANNHGLDFKSYGVDDVVYNYIFQNNENDFEFFQKRCTPEGCAFLVYDGTLILYSERYIEQQEVSGELHITPEHKFKYEDRRFYLYGSCHISHGAYNSTYSVENGSNNTYIPKGLQIGSQVEAERFSKNMLRSVNKYASEGYLYSSIMTGYSAGSIVKLKNDRTPSWDGKVFLTHIRNDYANGGSKIFFRRLLEGY